MKKIVCYITEMPEDTFWLPISIKSCIDWADKIIIIDGSRNFQVPVLIHNNFSMDEVSKMIFVTNPYPHEDKGADGKQRNKYLEILKNDFVGDLAIVIDSDEVFADNAKEITDQLVTIFVEHPELDIFNARMEHFVENFSWIDATQEKHHVPGRIFRISSDLVYPEVEHVLIESNKGRKLNFFTTAYQQNDPVLYYHYGYTKGKETVLRKFLNHCQKSNIHSEDFLKKWYQSHILGTYPKKSFLGQHPKPVREVFRL